jgi:hypothetical protein
MKIGANRRDPSEYATPYAVIEKQHKEKDAARTLNELDDFEMEMEGEDEDEDMLDSDQEEILEATGLDHGADELGDEQDYQLEAEAGPASQESGITSDGLAALLSEFMQSQSNESSRVYDGLTYDQLHLLTGGDVHSATAQHGAASQHSRDRPARELSIDPSLL